MQPRRFASPVTVSAAATAAVAALTLLAGCGSSSTKASPASSAGTASASASRPASVHVVDTANAYSLDLPAGWAAPTDGAPSASVQITGPVGAKVSTAVADQVKKLYASGLKFVALADGSDLSSDNINVVVKPTPAAGKDPMALLPAVKEALSPLHLTSFSGKKTLVGDKPAAEIRYAYPYSETNDASLSARSIYVVDGDKTYIFTITVMQGGGGDVSNVDQIVSSIRVG